MKKNSSAKLKQIQIFSKICAFVHILVTGLTELSRQSLILLLPDPFRGMGPWRKTIEPQKPGNSPGPGPEVVKRQSRQRASGVKRP